MIDKYKESPSTQLLYYLQGQKHSTSAKAQESGLLVNSDPRIKPLNFPWAKNVEILAYTVENVMTKEECDAWIAESEELGYEAALLNTGVGEVHDPYYRKSRRCIIDSHEKAEWLWERIKDFIPSNFKGKQVVGLNERLRFLRYEDGDFFKPHYDGSYTTPDNSERSLVTIQMYLNEGFEGGETTFFGPNKEEVRVVPKIGQILVFEHRLLHEGSLLKSGQKYSMRTDVMYKQQ